jgi:hypothetical protein
MQEDERCCGTGTCIIDPAGYCWCGQKWDGEKMVRPPMKEITKTLPPSAQAVDQLPAPQTPPESAQTRS